MTPSVKQKSQKKIYGPKEFKEDGHRYRITAEVRHDDECGNGHNTFSITGTINIADGGYWREHSCGCIHEAIAKHFPELAPYIKWHLCSTDGPMHYTANVIYHAGDRDHWGLRKGERRQIVAGGTGLPAWHLVAIDEAGNEVSVYKVPANIDAHEQPPCPYRLEYRPWCHEGEGKERQLDYARSSAVWPEATDEELMQEPAVLTAMLEARLPKLMEDFQAAVESLGLTY